LSAEPVAENWLKSELADLIGQFIIASNARQMNYTSVQFAINPGRFGPMKIKQSALFVS